MFHWKLPGQFLVIKEKTLGFLIHKKIISTSNLRAEKLDFNTAIIMCTGGGGVCRGEAGLHPKHLKVSKYYQPQFTARETESDKCQHFQTWLPQMT